MAFNYSPKVVADGLVLYLDAANTKSYVSGSTRWNDISRGGKNGTLVNGPTFSSDNGGAIMFDGINDAVTYPLITLTNTYTLEFYGNMNGPINTSNRRSIFNDGINYFGEFSNISTYFTNITCDGTPLYFNFGFTGGITLGSNFHWVFTINSDKTNDIYVNGNLRTKGTQLTSYTTITSTFRRFGASAGGSRPYSGSLYTARIYNKTLSASEVLQNYNATKTRFGL
jgi:hypothetical protein